MDCDENFQRQNQQLAGEGSTKFSSVSQPYGLTKYDIDDNLQGHLRFDSLVENEVFLGIGNNIDSQWIADFSRGNGAIEFTTCASESCSISRHNNVWSEAASSESVEMLLKSVGQEETMPRQPAVRPSNSSKPFFTTPQMEPNATDDIGIISDKANASTGESLSSLTEILPSGTVENAGEEHRLFEEVVLMTWNGTSSQGNLMKEDSSIQSEKFGPSTIVNLYADGKDIDTAPGESEKAQHLSYLENQGVNTVPLVENVVMNYDRTENLSALDPANPIGNACHIETENDIEICESFLITMEACRNNGYLENGAASDVQIALDRVGPEHLMDACMKEGNDVEISTVPEPHNVLPKANLDAQSVEELGEGASATSAAKAIDVENLILDQDAGVGELSEVQENRSSSLSGLTKDLDKLDPEIGVRSSASEVPSGLEQPMDFSKQKSLVAVEISTDTSNVLDQEPFPLQVKSPASSTAAVLPSVDCRFPEDVHEERIVTQGFNGVRSSPQLQEEVLRNYAIEDSVSQIKGEQVPAEKSTLPVGPAEGTLDHLEIEQGLDSFATRDREVGFTNSEVPEKSNEAALGSSDGDDVANVEMDTSPTQLSGSVVPSELPSHQTTMEVDCEPCFKSTCVADGVASEMTQVAENEVLDKSGSMVRKGDDVSPALEKQDEVSLEGSSSMAPGSFCKSPKLPSNDDSDSGKANCSSPIAISSMELSLKEIDEEQNEKINNQKLPPSDGKHLLDLPNAKETEISKDDKSFTFDVWSLDKRDFTKNWQPFPATGDTKVSKFAVGGSTPALLQVVNQALMLSNVESSQKTRKETSRGRRKESSEHKTRRASGKGATKESGKKSRSVKDATASKQIETVNKFSPHSVTPQGAPQLLPSGELQHHDLVNLTTAKGFGDGAATTSGMPNLNSSTFANMVFRQPFTDLQQVQLRAQIFVYGSLISKLVPEEAHMMSAFGGQGGGRISWENALRVCRERVLGQASLPANLETPVKSRPGEVIFYQAKNQATWETVASSSAVRSNSKGPASPAINLVHPLTSPVWNISTQSFDALQFGSLPKGTAQPSFSTFHLNQSPPVANYFGPSGSWVSQAPFRSPWPASPQISVPNPSARVPLLPSTETVKLVAVSESPVSVSSGTVSLPSVPVGPQPCASPAVGPKTVTLLPGHHSAELKSRKRKTVSASADPGEIPSNQSQVQLSSIPAPIHPHSANPASAGPHLSIFAPASTSGFLSDTRLENHFLKSPPYLFGDPGRELDKSKSILPEESMVKVKEARKQAEDAAALASAAVNHSQEMWDQLNKHQNSGHPATAEVKLAAAAAAIAAAASVAKAAAAAASVASKAALQAKLMADEAINPSRIKGHFSHGFFSTSVVGKDASSSFLSGDPTTNFSNSAISAMREATRKRMEAASAASLQAENLDALVKAAEIAAEAIVKAGKVVAMGDPLPLTALAEAGPDGFWNLTSSKDSADLNFINVGNAVATITNSSQQVAGLKHIKGSKVSGTGNSEGNLLDEHQHSSDDATQTVEISQWISIKAGSQVEVLRSGEGSKAAWFSANVLSVKDGKALVCYSEIPSEEGSGKLEEWVELKCGGDEPPKLRIAHPMTVVKFVGARKRRRAVMGDFTCSAGDKVDAWIKDGWREGVVAERDEKDDTAVTVHFPAYGDTSVVRSWHLRPSLIWKNEKWVEWISNVGSMTSYLEGDIPQEKRAKLGTPGLAPKRKEKESKETQNLVEKEKPPLEESLNRTYQENVFHVGEKAVDGKKETFRTRTGLRKESSRVVIGVPKPGKKQKFMEVSKHLVGHQTRKTIEVKDSAKLASYLMPQQGGPRGWKPFSRNETKDKGVADSKAKVLRSGRSQTTSGRTIPPKSNLTTANSYDGPTRGLTDHGGLQSHNTAEFKPLSESEGAASEGRVDAVTSSDRGSLKASTATVIAARVTKGKVPSGKVAKDEDNKALNADPTKSAADGAEPRRSNRRIQPTSRLLEGLQSSITITKFPSSLHDRGNKIPIKDAAKGKSNS